MNLRPSRAATTAGLNRLTERLLLRLLRRVRQPWSRAFTEAMFELVPAIAVEAVILRRTSAGRVEVFLTERPSDDIHWRGVLAVPGTVIRATDQPTDQPTGTLFAGVLERLAASELKVPFAATHYVDIHHHGRGGRANNIQIIYRCSLDQDPVADGGWYPIDDLPARFLAGQQILIDLAAAHFGG
jgi:hypothetical protein